MDQDQNYKDKNEELRTIILRPLYQNPQESTRTRIREPKYLQPEQEQDKKECSTLAYQGHN